MKYTILMFSNQPFDSPMKTNKWHVSNILAQKGYKVIYVDPPLRFKALKEFLKKPSFDLSRLFLRTEVKNENLTVYKPANLFNFKPFSNLNTYIHTKSLVKMLSKNEKLVLWVYHFDFPDLRNFVKALNPDLLIYDVVDEYTAFPEYEKGKTVNTGVVALLQKLDEKLKVVLNQRGLKGVDWVLDQEKWLSDNAGLMFASAPGLVDKFKKWRDQVAYLPNGAAVDKFDRSKSGFKEPFDMKDIPHPRIGFAGAIDSYKNNIKLIEKCSQAYPDYNFIMIGPEKLSDPDLDLTNLKAMNNVHFLGVKPWEETPSYFAFFDVFFIPYNLNDYTVKGCFPVKYFESLAAGLPTVVTNMPAYKGFDVDGLVSKDDEEFIKNINKAVDNNSASKVEKRKALARQNSWEGKVNKQIVLIDEYFKKLKQDE